MSVSISVWRKKAQERLEGALDEMASEVQAELESRGAYLASQGAIRFAEGLNQTLRRLRGARTVAEVLSLTGEAAAEFAERSAVFTFRDGRAVAEVMRGLGGESLEFDPEEAQAFRAAIESRDAVVAIATPSEVSTILADRVGTETFERVQILPITVRGEVKAALFATGNVQPVPLEIVAGAAGLQMEALSLPLAQKREDLMGILPVPGATQGNPKTSGRIWADLSVPDQALHLKAQRVARVRVAGMRLDHAAAFQQGFQAQNLYQFLKEPIDAARLDFRQKFVDASPTMVDYLYLELVRGLADGDEQRLGEGFPEPLVI